VGVDLNTASTELLRYVSGLNQRAAKRIVEFRNLHGQFNSRRQLLEVPGFGEKTFEQAAGFLRIKNGANPLDATAVHPESYTVVERIAQALDLPTESLIGNGQALEKLDPSQFTDEKAGLYTIHDIKEELLKPGRDPRSQFVVPTFRDDVKEVSDLVEGMELEGTVTNVTNFGAFVDVGVHQDGLVHVSELSNRYVQDPREAVHVGQIVKVKVIGVDQGMKRISLSIKALLPKIAKPKPKRAKRPVKRSASQEPQAAAGVAAAEPGAETSSPTPASVPARPPRRDDRPPRRDMRPRPQTQAKSQDATRAEYKGKQNREIKPLLKPGKPAEQPGLPADMSFEEKIRMLREKFGGIK
jgi:protein Tex